MFHTYPQMFHVYPQVYPQAVDNLIPRVIPRGRGLIHAGRGTICAGRDQGRSTQNPLASVLQADLVPGV